MKIHDRTQVSLQVEAVRHAVTFLKRAATDNQLKVGYRKQLEQCIDELENALQRGPANRYVDINPTVVALVLRCLAQFILHSKDVTELLNRLLGSK